MLDTVIHLLSAMAVGYPLYALGKSVLSPFLASSLVVKDRDGFVVKIIHSDDVLTDSPDEMKRFHEDVHVRVRDVKEAA